MSLSHYSIVTSRVLGHLVISSLQSKFYYPLVPLTSTILNLVVQNPRVLVPKSFAGFSKPSGAKKKKQMKWPRYGKVKRIVYPYFVKHDVFFYD